MTIRPYLLSLLLLLPICANALGLKKIEVESALNEPLKARIELISVDPLEIDNIKASLADQKAFEKASIPRPFHLSMLRFAVIQSQDGKIHIQVTTRENVREPYLNFLLRVEWRGGDMLREYTILLDPPSYKPAAISTPAQAADQPPVSRANAQPRSSTASPGSYGPVKSSETLWVIAQKVRPAQDLSIEQTMIALQRKNPEAFRHNNVNYLKRGAELEIPSEAFVRERTREEAKREFQAQVREWKERRTGRTPASDATVLEPAPVENPPQQMAADVPATREEPRQPAPADPPPREEPETATQQLRVVEPEQQWIVGEESSKEQAYPTDPKGRLEEAIKDSEAELLEVQEINNDLQELKRALEEKINSLRKSIEERDQAINELKSQIETLPAAKAPPAIPAAEPKPEPTAIEVTTPLPGQVKTDLGPGAYEIRFIWYDAYWLVLAGLALLTLLVLALANRKRDRRPMPERSAMPDPFRRAPRSPDQESLLVESQPQPARPKGPTDPASSLLMSDIYLSYRQYDQAESIIRLALESHPDDLQLQAKLLEIMAASGDGGRFTSYLEKVHDQIATSPELLAQVLDAGRRLIPEHPLLQDGEEPQPPSRDNGEEITIEEIEIDPDDLPTAGTTGEKE